MPETQVQENNLVDLFEDMSNTSVLSEQKLPLKCKRGLINEMIVCGDFNKLSYNHSHQFNFLAIVGEHLKTNEDNWIYTKAWLFVILGIGSVFGLCFIAVRLAQL